MSNKIKQARASKSAPAIRGAKARAVVAPIEALSIIDAEFVIEVPVHRR